MVNGFATAIAAIDSQPEQMLQGSQGGEAAALLHSLHFGPKRILTSPIFPLALDDSRPDAEYFSQLVHLLGLDGHLDDYPHMLSGGAQQCTAIARALITKPSIVLADEPTGSFDIKTTQNVAGLLKMTAATFHQTLVVITHNLDLAQLADRVVRLQDGKIV